MEILCDCFSFSGDLGLRRPQGAAPETTPTALCPMPHGTVRPVCLWHTIRVDPTGWYSPHHTGPATRAATVCPTSHKAISEGKAALYQPPRRATPRTHRQPPRAALRAIHRAARGRARMPASYIGYADTIPAAAGPGQARRAYPKMAIFCP